MNGNHCRFGRSGTAATQQSHKGFLRMVQSAEAAAARIERLEQLVSHLRHDIRGAISSTSLIADALLGNSVPAVRRSGERIATTVERITTILNATLEIVPPRGA
jgi:hypothetical protein